MSDDLTLPPLMGFPQEEYYNPSSYVPFYTCLIGPFRIFIYCPGGIVAEGWVIERKANDPALPVVDQFFDYTGNSAGTLFDMHVPDPLACMAIIQQVTSESNEDASPTGPDENVLAPHLTEGCLPTIDERKP